MQSSFTAERRRWMRPSGALLSYCSAGSCASGDSCTAPPPGRGVPLRVFAPHLGGFITAPGVRKVHDARACCCIDSPTCSPDTSEVPSFVGNDGRWLVIRLFLYKTPPLFAAAPSAIRDHQYPFSQYVSAPGLIRSVSSSCAVGLGYFAGASGEYTFGGGANA